MKLLKVTRISVYWGDNDGGHGGARHAGVASWRGHLRPGECRHPLQCIVSPLSLSRRGYRPSDNLHSADRY